LPAFVYNRSSRAVRPRKLELIRVFTILHWQITEGAATSHLPSAADGPRVLA